MKSLSGGSGGGIMHRGFSALTSVCDCDSRPHSEPVLKPIRVGDALRRSKQQKHLLAGGTGDFTLRLD